LGKKKENQNYIYAKVGGIKNRINLLQSTPYPTEDIGPENAVRVPTDFLFITYAYSESTGHLPERVLCFVV
jgi:hypothetical protein